jgi:hypothetical protein
MSLEMAQKFIVPQKKIMSRSFLNSGTLIVIEHVGSDRSSESRLTQEPNELRRSPHIFPTNIASSKDLKTRSLK